MTTLREAARALVKSHLAPLATRAHSTVCDICEHVDSHADDCPVGRVQVSLDARPPTAALRIAAQAAVDGWVDGAPDLAGRMEALSAALGAPPPGQGEVLAKLLELWEHGFAQEELPDKSRTGIAKRDAMIAGILAIGEG